MTDQAHTVLAPLSQEFRQRCSFVAQGKFHYTELQGVSACKKAEMAAEMILGDVLDQFDSIFGACETPSKSRKVRGGDR